MKIGVMLRHLGQPGGIGVYTVNVLNALFKLDQKNQYFLLYHTSDPIGKFSQFNNVIEKVIPARSKLWWDQVSVLRYAKSEGLDLIYNPKLSIPLFTSCKTVLVMHGAEQFAVPNAFKWHDRMYFSIANRLYCKRASAIIAMTHLGAKDISQYMGADLKKIYVIPESYNEGCRILESDVLEAVRQKYNLPEHFLLFVGGLNPLKNFGNLLRAYSKIQPHFPHKLVTVGFKRWKFNQDLELIDRLGLMEQVIFTEFIPDEDIPAMYNLADIFVFPSLYEGFGIPVLEAFACGCPVVTTKLGCSPEVAGGAAILVDPYNPDQIAEAIERVITDKQLRLELIQKGLRRSQEFSWLKCARETIDLFECLGQA